MRGSGYGAAYTIYYFLVIFAVTSCFSFLTLAFCRRLLQTVTQVRDLFSLFLVLLSNAVVAVFLVALQCSVLSLLLYPWIWPTVPLLLQLFGQSPIAGLVLTLIGTICAPIFYWFTSASWLRIAIAFSLLPCLLIGFLILLNLLTRPFRRTFCVWIVSFFDMTLGSRKGIFSFCSFCFAVAIPLCSVIVWLAQLTLTPLVVGTLFVLSILTQVKYSVPQKRGLVA